MMSVSVVTCLPSSKVTTNGRCFRSTRVTLPCTISAPNRSACARISVIRSGPIIPSRNPGQFSTIVVSISCPPASRPSTSSGVRLARAVYSAAVSPAGPEPTITTLRSATLRSALGHAASDVPIDQLRDVVLAAQADDRLGELALLEEQQRRNAAHSESAWDFRVLVDIQLRDRQAPVVLRGERVHRGRKTTTGAAPFCPEVDEDQALLGLLVEVAVSERLHLVGCHEPSPGTSPAKAGHYD